MDLNLTAEHLMIAKSAREFAIREVYPNLKERDILEKSDPALLKKLGEEGFLGLCIPKKYGGLGLDFLSLGLVSLEFEKVDSSLRFILLVHLALNSIPLLMWGTEHQKRKYLIPQAQGKKIGAFAMAEPNSGSDLLGLNTIAVNKGDYYLLNGEKTWITLASEADNFLLFAYTDKEKKYNGISAFIVERDFLGVTTSTLHGKLGMRAGNTGSISLMDVKVPKENLLGNVGDGYKIGLSALEYGLYTVASGAVGTIEACLEASINYAHERETFGKEIGKHELVQEMIAHMVSSRDIGRLLIYNVGSMKNKGQRNLRETFLSKWVNCNNAFNSANDALEIFGAYGYSNEFDIERYFRNARGALIYGLTREIHTVFQAEYALGYKEDEPLGFDLPAWPFKEDLVLV